MEREAGLEFVDTMGSYHHWQIAAGRRLVQHQMGTVTWKKPRKNDCSLGRCAQVGQDSRIGRRFFALVHPRNEHVCVLKEVRQPRCGNV